MHDWPNVMIALFNAYFPFTGFMEVLRREYVYHQRNIRKNISYVKYGPIEI